MATARKIVGKLMVFILPVSLMAQDSSRAMVHSQGGVWVNGNVVAESSALFPEDVVQTQKDHAAKIDADGSSVIVLPETVVQFEGNELVLDHGMLQVDTSRGLKVRVNCLVIEPVAAGWTQYDVTDVDGKVSIAARKSDVKLHDRGSAMQRKQSSATTDAIVHEGEQKTRDEHCGPAAKPSAGIDANGPILNHLWARIAGVGAAGLLACWGLCRTDDTLSPSKP